MRLGRNSAFRRKPTGRREYPPSRKALRANALDNLEIEKAGYGRNNPLTIRTAWRRGVPIEKISQVSGKPVSEIERIITMEAGPNTGEGSTPAADPVAPPAESVNPPADAPEGTEAQEGANGGEDASPDLSGHTDAQLAEEANRLRQAGDPDAAADYDRELGKREDSGE